MADTISPIPVVNFSGWADGNEKQRKAIAAQLVQACRTVGFCYITNHGISPDYLSQAFGWSKKLFDLTQEEKMLAPHPSGYAVHRGYSWPGLEKVSNAMGDEEDVESLKKELRQVSDIKESYEIGSERNHDQPNQWLPEHVLPGFRDFMNTFYWDCHWTARKLLSAMAIGIGLRDDDFFAESHPGHNNQLRLLHYPPVPAANIESQASTRMGAHSDWPSITLLFQDDCGGLQIENPQKPGEFMDVPPIQDALVMNVGDLMMRWSNDTLKSTVHRVSLPPRQNRFIGDNRMTKARYSIPYFVSPKGESIVECLPSCTDAEHPAKYGPIKWNDYMLMRASMQYESRPEEALNVRLSNYEASGRGKPPVPFIQYRSVSLRKILTKDTGERGPYVLPAFKDVNYDFASTAPKKRTHVRQPIIINGAGPAGLVLGLGLQNAKIPFEICEQDRHDLPSKPRRNHISILSTDILKPLQAFLGLSHYEWILKETSLNADAQVPSMAARQRGYHIKTEPLLELLRRQLRVNYGLRLDYGGISCAEGIVTGRYRFGESIRTFEGSLLVGADGMFSSGQAKLHVHEPFLIMNRTVRGTVNMYVWPALAYVSTVVVSLAQYESNFEGFLDGNGAKSLLLNNTRLALTTNSVSPNKVQMSLWYSRMTRSMDDFHAFYGFNPDTRDIPHLSYQFNSMIAEELNSLKPLPPPFAAAYEFCKGIGISQKWHLNAVRMGRGDLATDVFSGGLTMPAVLIGNAAHAIPEILSPGDINYTIMDAMDLCAMIVNRYDNDQLFSHITADYYSVKYHQWEMLPKRWVVKWMAAHGLISTTSEESLVWANEAKSMWTKTGRAARNEEPQSMPASEFEKLSEGDRLAIQRYKVNEAARKRYIEQRIRDQLTKKDVFAVPPGVQPTKLVIRYVDERSQTEKNDKRKGRTRSWIE